MRLLMDVKKILIVGLGNPGMLSTRHSVGMQAVNSLAQHFGGYWTKDAETHSNIASVTPQPDLQLLLLKSRKFMNVSGTSVKRAARKYSIEPSHIFLIVDELDKKVGKFGIKTSGSARGHNGVKSVMNALCTQDVTRLLIGIDRPASKDDIVDYVLTKFDADERPVINSTIEKGLNALLTHIEQQVDLEKGTLCNYLTETSVCAANQT